MNTVWRRRRHRSMASPQAWWDWCVSSWRCSSLDRFGWRLFLRRDHDPAVERAAWRTVAGCPRPITPWRDRAFGRCDKAVGQRGVLQRWNVSADIGAIHRPAAFVENEGAADRDQDAVLVVQPVAILVILRVARIARSIANFGHRAGFGQIDEPARNLRDVAGPAAAAVDAPQLDDAALDAGSADRTGEMNLDAAGIVVESEHLVGGVAIVLAAMRPVDAGDHDRLVGGQAAAHFIVDRHRVDRCAGLETVDARQQQAVLAAGRAASLAALVRFGRREAHRHLHGLAHFAIGAVGNGAALVGEHRPDRIDRLLAIAQRQIERLRLVADALAVVGGELAPQIDREWPPHYQLVALAIQRDTAVDDDADRRCFGAAAVMQLRELLFDIVDRGRKVGWHRLFAVDKFLAFLLECVEFVLQLVLLGLGRAAIWRAVARVVGRMYQQSAHHAVAVHAAVGQPQLFAEVALLGAEIRDPHQLAVDELVAPEFRHRRALPGVVTGRW